MHSAGRRQLMVDYQKTPDRRAYYADRKYRMSRWTSSHGSQEIAGVVHPVVVHTRNGVPCLRRLFLVLGNGRDDRAMVRWASLASQGAGDAPEGFPKASMRLSGGGHMAK